MTFERCFSVCIVSCCTVYARLYTFSSQIKLHCITFYQFDFKDDTFCKVFLAVSDHFSVTRISISDKNTTKWATFSVFQT